MLASLVAPSKPLNKITLTKANSVWLVGDINGNTPQELAEKIKKARAKRKKGPLYLVIASNGGEVSSIEALQAAAVKHGPVHIVVLFAGSMAALVSQAVGTTVYIFEKGLIAFHEPSVTLAPGPFTKSQISEFCEWTVAVDEDFLRASSVRLKISYEEFRARIKHQDWVLNADRAVAEGAADHKAVVECDKRLRAESPVFVFSEEEILNLCELIDLKEKK